MYLSSSGVLNLGELSLVEQMTSDSIEDAR